MKTLRKYTKKELVLLTKLYKEGLSIYKIARDLKRSQKSVRNNLIRLGLLEGKIITYKNDVIIDNKKSIINTTNLLLIILLLISIIQLQINFLEFTTYYQSLVFINSLMLLITMTYKLLKKIYNLIFLSLYIYILMM